MTRLIDINVIYSNYSQPYYKNRAFFSQIINVLIKILIFGNVTITMDHILHIILRFFYPIFDDLKIVIGRR